MPYRFVHAADIHLDSPLRSLVLRDPELAELIGNATRRAFVSIIDLCLTEQVDALLLAGDLYDGDQTSMKTARFLAQQLRRLHAAGIQDLRYPRQSRRIVTDHRGVDLSRLSDGVWRACRSDRGGTAKHRISGHGSRSEFRPACISPE